MNLWRLEVLRLLRTYRMWILVGIFGFFGFLGPLTAAYLPEIVDRLGGGVEISVPEAATPMMIDSPQPLWQHSRAWRITSTLPMHSKL